MNNENGNLEKIKKTAALIDELLKSLKSLTFSDREYLISQNIDGNLLADLQAAKGAAGDLISDYIKCPKCESQNVKVDVLESKFEAGKADFEVINISCKNCLNYFSEF